MKKKICETNASCLKKITKIVWVRKKIEDEKWKKTSNKSIRTHFKLRNVEL